MGAETNMSFVDSTGGNFVIGCHGCELENRCWAYQQNRQRKWVSDFWSPEVVSPGKVSEVARLPDLRGTPRVGKPWLNDRPRLIFIGDLTDLMIQSNEVLFREVILPVMTANGSRHEWLLLTKRPLRLVELDQWLKSRGIDWPSNLWPGTTVTGQKFVHRLNHLQQVGGEDTVRWASIEPLWGWVDLKLAGRGLRWCFVGGESGAVAMPCGLDNLRDVVDQFRAESIPVFVKQLGERPVEWLDPAVKMIDDGGETRIEFEGQRYHLRRSQATAVTRLTVGGRVFEPDRSIPIRPETELPGIGPRVITEDKHGEDWNDPAWPGDLRVREYPQTF